MSSSGAVFNPPPGWPAPPADWKPPAGWAPDPSWPDPPAGWELWLEPSSAYGVVGSAPPDGVAPVSSAVVETATDEDLISALRLQIEELRNQLHNGSEELVDLDDEHVLQSVGIYRYHHPLENATAYKDRLSAISGQISDLVKSDTAIEKSNLFTFDNSLAKGRKMTSDLSKLMLRAYNAEADSSIRSLRAGNVVTAKKRIESSRNAIAKLGRMMEMHISDDFHALRLAEVELTADWLMKKQEEKEEAREERARLREEKKVEQELAAERAQLEKEREHLANALASLRSSGDGDPDLEQKLLAIDEAIARNDYRAANIRAGYVYVISNRGAFGENVVKIGLTRRLEPLDRVSELSGAAVPFRFDVHALFFSEDAVTLENDLHKHFADRRLNHANQRKEFFFASPAEVRDVLIEKVGNLLEFAEHADSTEYLQSIHHWPATDETAI